MRYLVIESHPNLGGFCVGGIGDERKIISYLENTQLNYIYMVLELKENGQDVSDMFLEWDYDNLCFSKVKE